MLRQCIVKNPKIKRLDLNSLYLNNRATYNLIESYYSVLNTLTKFPNELFNNNNFLESEENIEVLCQCITKQRNLLTIDF